MSQDQQLLTGGQVAMTPGQQAGTVPASIPHASEDAQPQVPRQDIATGIILWSVPPLVLVGALIWNAL